MEQAQVIIVGSGAAGALAAIRLGEAGIPCTLLEGGDRLLKKLLVTGNGRCNITNEKLIEATDVSPWFSCHDPAFGFDPLYAHGTADSIALFRQLGLPLTTLEEGKMYPKSLQASAVSDLLRLRLDELAVPVRLNQRVRGITRHQGRFTLRTQTESFTAATVLITTGGQAMPATGSDGAMFRILRELGHSIIKPIPALVQLMTDFGQLRALAGVKAEARLRLEYADETLATEAGELLFTDYGVSGPPVLQLSRFASPLIDEGKLPRLHIDLFPEETPEQVLELIQGQQARFPHREAHYLLNGIVHKKLIPVLLRQCGLDKMNRPAGGDDARIWTAAARMLTDWTMTITGTKGFANSQSTLGGVDLREVDHQTMASVKVPGLYFAGEVLDVCGACGGYNLQWAWSSALAAAQAIIDSHKR